MTADKRILIMTGDAGFGRAAAAEAIASALEERDHGKVEVFNPMDDALAILHHWLEDDGPLLAERAENARQIGRPEAVYQIAERAWTASDDLRIDEADQAAERSRLSELLARYDIRW